MYKNFVKIIATVAIFIFGTLLTGCGGNKQAAAPQKVPVKAMKMLQQSIPIVYGFPDK